MLVIQTITKDLNKRNKIQKSLLLIFSFGIIITYDYWFCLCVLFTSAVTYSAGILIEKKQDFSNRYKIAAVTILCLFLGIFKYANYFIEFAAEHISKNCFNFRLLFPIGISFYIFSAIGYVIDVANKKTEVEKSFADMTLFLCFFPKIVCGPIAKARDFLPQLKESSPITYKKFEMGIQFWLVGFFKKVVLADHLALFVDVVYSKPALFSTETVWLAAFTYFMQMYLDFSGYSDMAYGIAKVFGYELPMNFNIPFVSRNISDFWSRWHISLTSWLTEYVFNPVALSLRRIKFNVSKEQKKKLRTYFTYIAIIVTFLVSGIWHGVGAVYLVWGLCHGIISVIHAAYTTWIKKAHPQLLKAKPVWLSTVDIAANLFVIILLEALFRAETFEAGMHFFSSMFTLHKGIVHIYVWSFVALGVMILSALVAWNHKKKCQLQQITSYYPIQNLRSVMGLTVFFTFLGITLTLGYFGETFFVYGNF